ncbi:lipoate--protein ligase family protein [Vibrio sonorensis]|uniref:lipoate--protein ligase family protein n=1 Tax=Vibrio sonorensis TaxID=1004316 RepID=UPI0008DA4F65|nr:lipoate--protein ligase [Vibrio sonorensis]
MAKSRAKVLRYDSVEVATVFDTEHQLLENIQSGQLDQALLLWQSSEETLVLPSGSKWQQSKSLKRSLRDIGWNLYTRKTGGAPVPQTRGVINVSYMYALPEQKEYSVSEAYEHFCDILSAFFQYYGIEVKTHETPGSYCDGKYNLNINQKKVVGTAQRVVLRKGGGKVVLAQACILVDTNPEQLVSPVNLCYQNLQMPDKVVAQVHTNLFDHTASRPTVSQLFQVLFNCFVDAQKQASDQ